MTTPSTYRPPRRCAWCLKPAWSNRETCRECLSVEPNLRRPVTEAHALTGGEWVLVGSIMRWTGSRPADDEHITRRTPAQCGTESGATMHSRRHEKVCDECKAAKAEAARRRYQRRRDAA